MRKDREVSLSLTLFVSWDLLVNHVNAAFTTNNFVVSTTFFDTGTDFHVNWCLLLPTTHRAVGHFWLQPISYAANHMWFVT